MFVLPIFKVSLAAYKEIKKDVDILSAFYEYRAHYRNSHSGVEPSDATVYSNSTSSGSVYSNSTSSGSVYSGSTSSGAVYSIL